MLRQYSSNTVWNLGYIDTRLLFRHAVSDDILSQSELTSRPKVSQPKNLPATQTKSLQKYAEVVHYWSEDEITPAALKNEKRFI